MGNCILKDNNTGLYLCNGSFIGKTKEEATKLTEDKAVKLEKAFNTISSKLSIKLERI